MVSLTYKAKRVFQGLSAELASTRKAFTNSCPTLYAHVRAILINQAKKNMVEQVEHNKKSS